MRGDVVYVTDLDKLYIRFKVLRTIFPAMYTSDCECQTYFHNLYRKRSSNMARNRFAVEKYNMTYLLIINRIKIGISLKYVIRRLHRCITCDTYRSYQEENN